MVSNEIPETKESKKGLRERSGVRHAASGWDSLPLMGVPVLLFHPHWE